MAVLLVLQGAVFAIWGFWAFRCLFRLRARAVAQTGRSYPGLGATLRSFADFLQLPEFQRDRRILGGLTLLLWALILAFAFLRPI